ncbi:putative molybdenum carrier protein [Myxococcota bacterium]|nr:putative molybdenum carrier protein [Myxococcota bacterium]
MLKVVSGGQTGVDRAALDAALALGLEVGGWCPRGRWSEDGPIPPHYPLAETRSPDVHVRTQRNVECSTATLVITRGSPMGGTRLTVEFAQSMRRPLLVVDLCATRDPVGDIVAWLSTVRPEILNVAGPRESGAPGITEQASFVMYQALSRAKALGLTDTGELELPELPHARSYAPTPVYA